MNSLELLNEVGMLEKEGYVIVLKWDGEREDTKKTVLILKPSMGLLIRRDSDDLWASLEDAIHELRTQASS